MSRRNFVAKRNDFEALFVKHNPNGNIEHAADGGYVDYDTEQAYAAYNRAFKQALGHLKSHGIVTGPLLVGKMTDGRVSMNNLPYMHHSKEAAFEEAQRLADEHSEEYLVFGCIGKIKSANQA